MKLLDKSNWDEKSVYATALGQWLHDNNVGCHRPYKSNFDVGMGRYPCITDHDYEGETLILKIGIGIEKMIISQQEYEKPLNGDRWENEGGQ